MTNKFADDVKRIVGQEDAHAEQPALQRPGGKESVRGIGFQTFGGKTTSATGGVDTPEDEEGDEEDTSENKSQEEAENNADAPNPNDQTTLSHNKNAGVVDADDLIDGKDGPTDKASSIDALSSVASSTPGGSLTGINATDCDTGNDLEIRIDGNFTPRDEATHTDSAGDEVVNQADDGNVEQAWPNPDTPPTLDGYEDGVYWSMTASGTTRYSNSLSNLAAFSDVIAIVWGTLVSGGGGVGSVYEGVPGSNYRRLEGYAPPIPGDISYVITYSDATSSDGPFTGGPFRSSTIFKHTCNDDGSDPAGTCPAEAPTASMWPDDDTISLKKVNGKFVTSEYDREAQDAPQFSGQQRSAIDFCMDGGRTGRIRAGRDGGTVIHETGSGGAPTGAFKFYASDGTFAAAGDVQFMDSVLPRDSD